jgi:homoserine dehydrogenase
MSMRVAILGAGCVAGGVVEMLQKYKIEIVYIGVRDVTRQRDFQIPPGTIVTDNIDLVVADKTIDVVVELMGGTDTAWNVVKTCLERGVNVVTANKALISKYIVEIEEILSKHLDRPPAFMYEAAVAGGIPIINTFLRGMAGDEIKSIYGVMNGSTNWMLDRMDREGVSYGSLLAEAKSLGFLEADPSADILGWDARSKLCILARIAFGIALQEDSVFCAGIHTISQQDIKYAKSIGKTIKLLARAWKDGHKLHAFVVPAMVSCAANIGNLPGPTNCVCFEAKYSGSHAMIGSGAGRYPTANSVVADILEIHRNKGNFGGHFGNIQKAPNTVFDSDFSATFYIRISQEGIEAIKATGVDYTPAGEGSIVIKLVSHNKLKSIIEKHLGTAIVVM